ncbi:FUSC family protein [Cryobacterium frigoriphilum]|nr:aromatic acid exporter family protein [Cryobacterium frigoriphilum]
MPPSTAGTARGLALTLALLKRALRHPRTLQVAKISVAVAIAWSLAPLLPGDAQQFRYYAPLGALLSMHPTLMRSVRSALQTVAGLAIGIGLAGVMLLLSEPGVWTISLVIGLGTLIGGMRWLGVGGEHVPLTALFVLIIGGPEADGYSIAYFAQICLGILVGLAVNLVILPPLAIGAAVERLSGFRLTLATHLTEIAEALDDSWPPRQEQWALRGTTLSDAARDVRLAVRHADESRKGNPRARFTRHDLVANYDDLAALEDVTFHVRNLTEVFAGVVWGKPVPLDLPVELRPVLSDALRSVASVLHASEGSGTGSDSDRDYDEQGAEAFNAAVAVVDSILGTMQQNIDAGVVSLSPTAAIVIDLKRMLVALRPGIERNATTEPAQV